MKRFKKLTNYNVSIGLLGTPVRFDLQSGRRYVDRTEQIAILQRKNRRFANRVHWKSVWKKKIKNIN